MSIPAIQTSAFLELEVNHSSIRFTTCSIVEGFNLAANTDGTISLPPFRCHIFFTAFDSSVDSLLKNSALDAECKIELLARLVHVDADRLCTDLCKSTIDLSDHNPKCYFSSSPVFEHPYYHTHIVSERCTNITVPKHGKYVLKVLAKRIGIDNNFTVQYIAPLSISPGPMTWPDIASESRLF